MPSCIGASAGWPTGGWAIFTRTKTVLTSTASRFQIQATLDADEGEKRIYCRNWDVAILRDCV